jgi:hypothetical protein
MENDNDKKLRFMPFFVLYSHVCYRWKRNDKKNTKFMQNFHVKVKQIKMVQTQKYKHQMTVHVKFYKVINSNLSQIWVGQR